MSNAGIVMLPNPIIERNVILPDGSTDTIRMNAPFTIEEMAKAYDEQKEEVEGNE